MRYPLRTAALVAVLLAVVVHQVAAQRGASRTYPRARPPKFDGGKVGTIYFGNAFEVLIGQRPTGDRAPAVAAVPDIAPAPAAGGGYAWSSTISSASLEDEVKSLKGQLDKTVTTPADFAGRGHRDARRQFSLLAVLFAVIKDYDGDVRWQKDAEVARNRFARVASNAKAGGSIQVYNEAKARHQDLSDLILGSGLPGDGGGQPDVEWGSVVDRVPVMQLLKDRFEANLKQSTTTRDVFEESAESLVREAELVAMIADVLTQEGMPDGDDAEYQEFARVLRTSARNVVEAVNLKNIDMAKESVTAVIRSCDECHNTYR